MAAQEFFVNLGDFAGDYGGAVAEDFQGVFECVAQTMRRFV